MSYDPSTQPSAPRSGRSREGVARVFLWAGFGMFLAFNALPVISSGLVYGPPDTDRGYEIWKDLRRLALSPASIEQDEAVAVSCFLFSSLAALVAPLAMKLMRNYRFLWWCFTLMATVAGAGFTWIIGSWISDQIDGTGDSRIEVGMVAFLTFPYLTLVGLVCLRISGNQSRVGEV